MSDFRIPPDHVVHDEPIAMAATPYSLPPDLMNPIWEKFDGRGITIINLDTGWVKHPDLPVPTEVRNFTGGSASDVTDRNGHGTHTIGTHSGRNGIGVAPGSDIKVGKVLGTDGGGSNTNAGLDWAASIEGDIVSCSWGATGPTDPATRQSCQRVIDSGKILLFSAGNSGSGRDTVISPANSGLPHAIAATDENDNLGSFSSTGPEVDLAGPGVKIISANYRGGRTSMSGTSMSCPFVAGAVALMKQMLLMMGYAHIGHKEILNFLMSEPFLKDAGPVGRDNQTGHGIVTFRNMMNWIVANATKMICLFVMLSLAGTASAQSVMTALAQREAPAIVTTEAVRAFAADSKAVTVEPAGDKTVVFVTDDVAIENGVLLSVETAFKNSRIKLIRSEFEELDLPRLQNGKYVLIDKPGKYGVRVGLWDDQLGFDWLTLPVVIGGTPTDPTDPPNPDVPELDFVTLKALARSEAEKIGDAATAHKLAAAFNGLDFSGKPLPQAINMVQAARGDVLLMRPKPQKPWNGWLVSIDTAMLAAQITTVEQYAAAIKAIASGLQSVSQSVVVAPLEASVFKEPTPARLPVVRRALSQWTDPDVGMWDRNSLTLHLKGDLESSQHRGLVPAAQLVGRTLRELLDIHDNLHEGFSWNGQAQRSRSVEVVRPVRLQWTFRQNDCPNGVCPAPAVRRRLLRR